MRIPGGRRTSRELWAEYRQKFPKYFWSDETRLADVFVSRAEGSKVVDTAGKEYIDFTSQWATNNLGNVPAEVLEATVAALRRYGFLIYFLQPHLPMLELADRLLSIRPAKKLTRVLLELSGTGAAEGAVKYAVEASGRPLILSFLGQYHGLSIATGVIGSLSSHERRFWEAYQGGVVHAPYPQPYHRPRGMSAEEYGDWILDYLSDELLQRLAAPDRIAGAILEPVALEAGVWIPPKRFVRGLKKLCDEHGWFFLDDEVESGLGRTGRMWAIEHFGVEPDLMSIGKAISGGLMPIAAVMGSEAIMGEHAVGAGTTFGGHPAACVAASKTIEIMVRDRIPERSSRVGAAALRRLREFERLDAVGDVRGIGLALAVELVKDRRTRAADPKKTRRVFFDCVRHGLIPLYNYGDSFLRIEPPLTIASEDLDHGLDVLEASIRRAAR